MLRDMKSHSSCQIEQLLCFKTDPERDRNRNEDAHSLPEHGRNVSLQVTDKLKLNTKLPDFSLHCVHSFKLRTVV